MLNNLHFLANTFCKAFLYTYNPLVLYTQPCLMSVFLEHLSRRKTVCIKWLVHPIHKGHGHIARRCFNIRESAKLSNLCPVKSEWISWDIILMCFTWINKVCSSRNKVFDSVAVFCFANMLKVYILKFRAAINVQLQLCCIKATNKISKWKHVCFKQM